MDSYTDKYQRNTIKRQPNRRKYTGTHQLIERSGTANNSVTFRHRTNIIQAILKAKTFISDILTVECRDIYIHTTKNQSEWSKRLNFFWIYAYHCLLKKETDWPNIESKILTIITA